MAHWNYRLIKTSPEGDAQYSIHEVYYSDSGAVDAWSENAMPLSAGSIEDMRIEGAAYLAALDNPVLVEQVVDGHEVLVEELAEEGAE